MTISGTSIEASFGVSEGLIIWEWDREKSWIAVRPCPWVWPSSKEVEKNLARQGQQLLLLLLLSCWRERVWVKRKEKRKKVKAKMFLFPFPPPSSIVVVVVYRVEREGGNQRPHPEDSKVSLTSRVCALHPISVREHTHTHVQAEAVAANRKAGMATVPRWLG